MLTKTGFAAAGVAGAGASGFAVAGAAGAEAAATPAAAPAPRPGALATPFLAPSAPAASPVRPYEIGSVEVVVTNLRR